MPTWEQEAADGFLRVRGAESKAGPLRLLVYAAGIGLQPLAVPNKPLQLTGDGEVYKRELGKLLQSAPRLAP
jgi:hypothetical protein